MSPENPSTGARVTATRLPSGETAGSHSSCPGSAATRRSQGKSVLVASRQIRCSNGASSAALVAQQATAEPVRRGRRARHGLAAAAVGAGDEQVRDLVRGRGPARIGRQRLGDRLDRRDLPAVGADLRHEHGAAAVRERPRHPPAACRRARTRVADTTRRGASRPSSPTATRRPGRGRRRRASAASGRSRRAPRGTGSGSSGRGSSPRAAGAAPSASAATLRRGRRSSSEPRRVDTRARGRGFSAAYSAEISHQ